MNKEKYYVCTKSGLAPFKFGEVYGISETFDGHYFRGSDFFDIDDVAFLILCLESQDYRFTVGEYYFVDMDGYVIGDRDGKSYLYAHQNMKQKSYLDWYNECNWNCHAFSLIKQYNNFNYDEAETDRYICTSSHHDYFTVGHRYNITEVKCGLDCDVKFNLVKNTVFMIECMESDDNEFKVGRYYFVNYDGQIIGTDRKCVTEFNYNTSYYDWYEGCNWTTINFKLIKDYRKKSDEIEVEESSNKEVKDDLCQDTNISTYDKSGDTTFDNFEMINITFVKYDNDSKIHVCKNKSDKTLKAGTKVRVRTYFIERDAVVVSSIVLLNKYLPDLMKVIYSNELYPIPELGTIIGLYEERLIKLEENE